MSEKEHLDDVTQAKLKRLERLDEKNRARVRRYHEKVKASGNKQLSAIISGQAYDQLCRIRDAGIQAGEQISFGKIIENALACYVENQRANKTINDGTSININGNSKDTPQKSPAIKAIGDQIVQDIKEHVRKNPSPIIETQTEIPPPGDRPDRTDKGSKDHILNEMARMNDLNISWSEIAESLNNNGIRTIRGKQWDKKSAWQFYNRNKKNEKS